MLEYDFEQSVGYWMHQGAQAYQRALTEEIAPHGITFRQAQVLGLLALQEALSQTELAERMGIEPPTLVGILDRMERDGWISRNGCEQDKRKKLIRAMPEAKPVWAKIAAAGRKIRARAARGLSETQLATLKDFLETVRHNLEEPEKSRRETT
jgi:MarR family transcriptional regulator for hemolysin